MPKSVTDFAIRTRYVWDMGVRCSGVAGPAGSTEQAFTQLYAPRAFKIITWSARTDGGYGYMPSPDTGDPNDVFLYKVMDPAMPGEYADQTPDVQVTGHYVYGLRKPPSDNDLMVPGRDPYNTLPAGVGNLSLSPGYGFQTDIINSPGVSAVFVGFPFDPSGNLLVGGGQPYTPPSG